MGRRHEASHASSVASSVGKPRTTRQQNAKQGRQKQIRRVSFTSVRDHDEGDQESSIGHADDERLENGSDDEGSANGPRRTGRTGQHVQTSSTVHALRSRAQAHKDTTSAVDKHTPARKGKGKAVVKAKSNGAQDVDMEDADSAEEDSDGSCPFQLLFSLEAYGVK